MKKFNVDEICNRFTDSEITLRYNEIYEDITKVIKSLEQSHQLQVVLDVGLTHNHLSIWCVSTYSKVIISCRMHQTLAWQHKHLAIWCILRYKCKCLCCQADV